MSIHDVARAAAVSKALVLYHFTDREGLLVRLVERLAAAVVARERGAFGLGSSGTPTLGAVDALWRWVSTELARGEIRVLLDVASGATGPLAEVARRAARARRQAAAVTVAHLFDALGLKPRVPPELMAHVAVAFLDGLALDAAIDPTRNQRVAFDVFWLSLLSLAE